MTGCFSCLDHFGSVTEWKRAKGRFNASQWVPCGVLLMLLLPFLLPWRVWRTRRPGEAEGQVVALTSLKVDKLAAGRRKPCQLQPPGLGPPNSHFPSALCHSSQVWPDSVFQSSDRSVCWVAPQHWEDWKSQLSPERLGWRHHSRLAPCQ